MSEIELQMKEARASLAASLGLVRLYEKTGKDELKRLAEGSVRRWAFVLSQLEVISRYQDLQRKFDFYHEIEWTVAA